jgi:hypothetical protein
MFTLETWSGVAVSGPALDSITAAGSAGQSDFLFYELDIRRTQTLPLTWG